MQLIDVRLSDVQDTQLFEPVHFEDDTEEQGRPLQAVKDVSNPANSRVQIFINLGHCKTLSLR